MASRGLDYNYIISFSMSRGRVYFWISVLAMSALALYYLFQPFLFPSTATNESFHFGLLNWVAVGSGAFASVALFMGPIFLIYGFLMFFTGAKDKFVIMGLILFSVVTCATCAIIFAPFFGGVIDMGRPSHDQQVLSDLREAQNALDLYYRKCGFYPGGAISEGACPAAFAGAPNWLGMAVSLQSLPGIGRSSNDPLWSKTYYYSVNASGSSYIIGATLASPNNVAFYNYTPPSTGGYAGSVPDCTPPLYCVKL